MIEEQLVRRGITDERVIAAMRRIPRHLFVEEALRDRAYGDHPLPIGEGQTISQPYIVAQMTSLLALVGTEKILEVGTGSGYQTAVLAALARRVCSIERLPSLAVRARSLVEGLGLPNVWIRVGNGDRRGRPGGTATAGPAARSGRSHGVAGRRHDQPDADDGGAGGGHDADHEMGRLHVREAGRQVCVGRLSLYNIGTRGVAQPGSAHGSGP